MAEKRKKTEEREYDRQRRLETERKLKDGMAALRRKKSYSAGQPITEYALSKQTGVTRTTIKRHQTIVDLLAKESAPEVNLKTAKVNTDRIYTLEQALPVIKQMETLYNELTIKYNGALQANTKLNLQVVKLQDDLSEMKRVLKKREE